jgi:hypothetical protein
MHVKAQLSVNETCVVLNVMDVLILLLTQGMASIQTTLVQFAVLKIKEDAVYHI